jgi:aryl-phospho-beta-D-glucosidase BglC (GH1 family)
MEVESGNDPNIYNELGCPGAPDEWTCCEMIGKDKCGAALEKRYASFITKSDIDFMKSYGINTLRIPTSAYGPQILVMTCFKPDRSTFSP